MKKIIIIFLSFFVVSCSSVLNYFYEDLNPKELQNYKNPKIYKEDYFHYKQFCSKNFKSCRKIDFCKIVNGGDWGLYLCIPNFQTEGKQKKNSGYYFWKGKKFKGIDFNSFIEIKNSYYAIDKNHIIHDSGKIFFSINSNKFKRIVYLNGNKTNYFTDEKNIFYINKKLKEIKYSDIDLKAKINDIYFLKLKKGYIFEGKKFNLSDYIKRKILNRFFTDLEDFDLELKQNLEKAILLQDFDLCKKTINVSYCRDKINLEIAKDKKNISFCYKITGKLKRECLFILNTIIEYKKKQTNYSEKEKLYNKAVKENSFEQCILLYKNKRLFDACQRTILQNAKTKNDCMKIYEIGSREYGKMCYSNLSLAKKDKNICKKMNNKYDSDRCIEHYNLMIKIRNKNEQLQ